MNLVRTTLRTRAWRTRRGVVSILAMMFLVLFSSLGVAMAVVSKGNLRTAATHLHVTRAIGAAETGLAIAQSRLTSACARFMVAKGKIDSGIGRKLWGGTMSVADGAMTVLPPVIYTESSLPAGIAAALVNHHATDLNKVTISGVVNTPTVANAPSGTDTAVYASTNWVVTPAVAIDGNASASSEFPAAFQITYAPLANGTDIRIIVTGYSAVNNAGTTFIYGQDSGGDRPLQRTIYQDFRISKQHKYSIVSPTKIMIGKNVSVTGPVAANYTDVTKDQGDPLLVKSDFFGLDPGLDSALTRFYAAVLQYDVDGDNRLRINHPTEGAGIPTAQASDKNSGNQPYNPFADANNDGYLDELDIFINFYDRNNDKRVTLSNRLTLGTPAAGLTPEFTADDDLALQIDMGNPDRNRNGRFGFVDSNRNGVWDVGEALNDPDDRTLGYRDGFIDGKDGYAKIRGRLMFKTTQNAWETARSNTDYQTFVRGVVQPNSGDPAVSFGVGSDQVPDTSTMDFNAAASPMQALANGSTFDQQVATALGTTPGSLSTYTETKASGARYFRANMSNASVKALTGQNIYERMPFNSPTFSDWYYRPRYENITFKNVTIPQGNNGLFVNCTFIGVTYIRSETANTHPNWQLYGKMNWDNTANAPVASTAALDKSDFLRYTTGLLTDGPSNYDSFPDPPVIGGVTRTGSARDTKKYSNNIRFHDCKIVGSIVTDVPQQFTQVRNKLQFTGSTRITSTDPDNPNDVNANPRAADMPVIESSSLMAPQYSVDIGQFNAPTDTFSGGPTAQNINLSGTIIAGELDARGNTNIDGALLLTFAPVLGQGPLQMMGTPVGNPANFNCTLGYFGPADGELEAVDPNTLPIVSGQRIVGWDTDGDGLPDVPSSQPQPAGSTAIPFYGYGRVNVRLNTVKPMPDGVLLPLVVTSVSRSYGEGKK